MSYCRDAVAGPACGRARAWSSRLLLIDHEARCQNRVQRRQVIQAVAAGTRLDATEPGSGGQQFLTVPAFRNTPRTREEQLLQPADLDGKVAIAGTHAPVAIA